jgi:hypothetical protein
MHILVEGVIVHELQLFLRHAILQGWFTWSEVQAFLTSFSYSVEEKREKPRLISNEVVVVAQLTCAQCLVLCRVIPFFIGERVNTNNAHWANMIRLLVILQLTLSPIIDDSTIAHMERLIKQHHVEFVRLYPDNFIPKIHFLVHFPAQCRDFGPLRYHMCMAFEAKHQATKNIRWYNYVNMPLSAMKNLRLSFHSTLIEMIDQTLQEGTASLTTRGAMTYKGVTYRKGDIICITDEVQSRIQFAEIVEFPDMHSIKGNIFPLAVFMHEKNCFRLPISMQNVSLILTPDELHIPWPLTKYRTNEHIFVVSRALPWSFI